MDVERFRSTSIAILRTSAGWQSEIARRLSVDSRTVRRWIAIGATPGWVDGKLAEMIGSVDVSWPRDEWLIGHVVERHGVVDRKYITHLQPPRFVARIAAWEGGGPPAARGGFPARLKRP